MMNIIGYEILNVLHKVHNIVSVINVGERYEDDETDYVYILCVYSLND